jgi:SAM-dependent methyltransferase
MPPQRDDNPLDPYRQAVLQHGAGFKATLWGSRESQITRFDVMIELANFDDCTIVDAGCGAGDFAARLIERSIAYRSYLGIDALESQIQAARARNLPRCEFHIGDLTRDCSIVREANADFVCFSGTLNTMEESDARSLVQAAFDAAAQGVVFNFLSDRFHAKWADREMQPARRFNTVAWIDWSMLLSSRVSFTQDYLDGHDATILIRHDE